MRGRSSVLTGFTLAFDIIWTSAECSFLLLRNPINSYAGFQRPSGIQTPSKNTWCVQSQFPAVIACFDSPGHGMCGKIIHDRFDDSFVQGKAAGVKWRRQRRVQLESARKFDDEMLEFPGPHDLMQAVESSSLGEELALSDVKKSPALNRSSTVRMRARLALVRG